MEAKANATNRLRSASALDEYLQCPSCECKLQRCEVQAHFEHEMQRLRQMQKQAVTEAETEGCADHDRGTSGCSGERRRPWTVFQRVQRNRQSRLKQRTRKRPAPAAVEHACPVCNACFPLDEIQRHAEQCLRRTNGTTNERDGSSSNEEDEGEEYEEYEWAGQKRVRVSSLLQGGYASLGIGQTVTNHNGGHNQLDEAREEEEDLNVDEDDTQIYGPPQYGEGDVIPPTTLENGSSEDNEVANYMRRLITAGSNSTDVAATVTSAAAPVLSEHAHNNECSDDKSMLNVERCVSPGQGTQHYRQIVEALKAKLRHYENQVQSKFKCLICLDDYRNPAISVSCWHVHCEECWLRSLGARKLCPQCNLITTPKDLRRIYM